MKAIKYITAALLIIIIAASLTACSHDITGTVWQLMRIEVRVNGAVVQEICPPENGEHVTFSFSDDGIFSACTDTGGDLDPVFGVWDSEDNYISLAIDGQDVRGVYDLDGDEFAIAFEENGRVVTCKFERYN